VKISGVMPMSASKAGVVSRSSSHGDNGEVRKLLGLKKSGDADNAEAIAWAAASSLTDIWRAADVSPSEMVCVCSEGLLEASIVK